VDDFAATFGITNRTLLECLVFCLLDDHSSEALEVPALYLFCWTFKFELSYILCNVLDVGLVFAPNYLFVSLLWSLSSYVCAYRLAFYQ
jgi:hypothetical protein